MRSEVSGVCRGRSFALEALVRRLVAVSIFIVTCVPSCCSLRELLLAMSRCAPEVREFIKDTLERFTLWFISIKSQHGCNTLWATERSRENERIARANLSD